MLTGLTYYRLRQVDLDGAAIYSPVATLAPSAWKAASVNAHPNPPERAAIGGDPYGGQVSVRVVDVIGCTAATTRQLIPLSY